VRYFFLLALLGCKGVTVNDDDDFLGSEDEIHAASGDELDLADTIARVNPVADQLQHFANMRSVKHQLLDSQAPFARITPPSVLKGTLGNQALVIPGQRKQVAAWYGEDAESLPFTVTVSPVKAATFTQADVPIAGFDLRPFAEIQWGTRSSLLSIQVDIGQGCQLTLGGSMVTVQVGLDLVSLATPPQSMLLAGMVSFYPIVRTQPITRTLYVADSTVFSIPAFGKSVFFIKKDFGELAKAATVIFFDSTGTEVGRYTVVVGAQQSLTFPLPGNAMFIRVVNLAGPDVLGELIFDLAL
jgi:hypothetical protein